MYRVLSGLLAGSASLLLSSSNVLAEPSRQGTVCPVASNAVVSNALGTPAELMDPNYGVTLNGSDTECLFSAGGELVLVRREAGFFADSAGVSPESAEQLRLLVNDDLDYQSVAGVGDAALWATVHDRSLASERMGVLISKQGVDALTIGVMDTPVALDRATVLTQAVVAAQAGQP